MKKRNKFVVLSSISGVTYFVTGTPPHTHPHTQTKVWICWTCEMAISPFSDSIPPPLTLTLSKVEMTDNSLQLPKMFFRFSPHSWNDHGHYNWEYQNQWVEHFMEMICNGTTSTHWYMSPIKKLAWDLDEWYWENLVQSKEEVFILFYFLFYFSNNKLGDVNGLHTKERKLLVRRKASRPLIF